MAGGCVRRCILLVPLAAALLALPGCDSYKSDIAAVKRAQTLPGESNEELVLDLAGGRATIEWSADQAKGYDNDDVVAVTAEINRLGQFGQRSKIELVFIRNRQSKQVTFRELRLNGRREDMLSGALDPALLETFKLRLQ